MPARQPTRGRRGQSPERDAHVRDARVRDAHVRRRATPPAAPRVALIGALTGALVALAGGGQLTWLSVPAALLAAGVCRSRGGAMVSTLAVMALTGRARP
jgi:hypothetical protein